MVSQKEKMLAGELYDASDPKLQAAHYRAQALLSRFNTSAPHAVSERDEILDELFDTFGDGAIVKPTLRCDYGFNVRLGARSFLNYDCVLLDCHHIDIGEDVQMGPGVHIYTASHPLDASQRRSGLELAIPVEIGDGVWLGGGTIVCPGVKIGMNTVVGAGSVVTKSLPAGILAAGNPCRMIREL